MSVAVAEANVTGLRPELLDLLRRFPNSVLTGQPIARHTTLGIGGIADALGTPRTEESLLAMAAACRDSGIPFVLLGGGSNVLFDDRGFRGLVIRTEGLKEIRIESEGRVLAAAGARLLEVLARAREEGLSGFEWADGIPGTVGGALVTNAGTALGSISDVLASFRAVDRMGRVAEHPASALALEYRTSRLRELGLLVLSARFQLSVSGDVHTASGHRRATFAAYRKSTQPAGSPNAGSIFKNPKGESAGRLIEQAGLKGARQGNAAISEAHANFIVNLGGATAEDVRTLLRLAQDRIRARTGIELEPEIVLLGAEGPRGLE